VKKEEFLGQEPEGIKKKKRAQNLQGRLILSLGTAES